MLPEGVSTGRRNFSVLALYQILLRTGWIFKTESIVMPAVLDTLAGPAWVRGLLPLLNRMGHSIPPLLLAQNVKRLRKKRLALFLSCLGMSASFLFLAVAWPTGPGVYAKLFPWLFLVIYAFFFTCTGLNHLAMGALQGKLVGTTLRGRLMLVSNVVGTGTAITAALLLLPYWLDAHTANYRALFGFVGMCFAVSACCSFLLAEPADEQPTPHKRVIDDLWEAGRVLRTDKNFGRLAWVAGLFGSSLMLFPHYQALARDRLGLDFDQMLLWIVVQNIGTGLFSLVIGPIADWRGNRLVLRITTAALILAPLLALALSRGGEWGRNWYAMVFILVGLTPVTFRLLQNYTLEISEPEDHPRYLSTLNVMASAPILASPLVGLLADVTSMETIFLGIACLIGVGWLLTFTLEEPRHKHVVLEEEAPGEEFLGNEET